jgi:hypothetical protein
MTELERRVAATQATEQRFRDRPFDWAKAATCIHLVRFHAAQLGHQLPIVPRFRSALGARKALKATGYDSLPALMDAHFLSVPAAYLRVGDVLAVPGDGGFDALWIKGGIDKFLGWTEQAEGCEIIAMSGDDIRQAVGAWQL